MVPEAVSDLRAGVKLKLVAIQSKLEEILLVQS